jgi:hypothetical protein
MKKLLGFIGLFASVIILVGTFAVFFNVLMFAGMSSAGSTDGFSLIAGLSMIVSIFLVWQLTRLVQSKKYINGFILSFLFILVIIFSQISFDSLHGPLGPQSIFKAFFDIF